MKKIAFFGGTFDPPHRGHLAIAHAAAERFALDHVLFAPAAVQPVKAEAVQASFVDRYAMVCLATQHDPRFVPSLIDAPRTINGVPRPNYTVESLARLRAWFTTQQAEVHLYALLGADSWLSIALWRDPERLLPQADWIVAGRPGFSLEDVPSALPESLRRRCMLDETSGDYLLQREQGAPIRIAVMTDLKEDVSATALRDMLTAGGETGEILPAPVADYIRKCRLYPGCP
jgi:nicotinate-nucleotide adenylyltransferase